VPCFDSSYLDEKNWKIVVSYSKTVASRLPNWAAGRTYAAAVAERVRKMEDAASSPGPREIDPQNRLPIAALIASASWRCAGAH